MVLDEDLTREERMKLLEITMRLYNQMFYDIHSDEMTIKKEEPAKSHWSDRRNNDLDMVLD